MFFRQNLFFIQNSIFRQNLLFYPKFDIYTKFTEISILAKISINNNFNFFKGKLEKKRKNLLGAPIGKKVVVFVDDLNMPKLDTYGSQPPIELLRQYQDFRGLYDREKFFWKDIENVIICSACAPPGGGRNPVTARMIRHFGMFSIPSPSDGALKTIFSAILGGFLQDFQPAVRGTAGNAVQVKVIKMPYRYDKNRLLTLTKFDQKFKILKNWAKSLK